MKKLKDLFDSMGKCKLDSHFYFDEYGDSIYEELIDSSFNVFPANSDIVQLYYAAKYSNTTHGNYSAKILYRRFN